MELEGPAKTIALLKEQLAKEEQANRELKILLTQLRKIAQSKDTPPTTR